MTILNLTTSERVFEYFSEAIAEAEEAVDAGALSTDDVINLWADAFLGWKNYYDEKSTIYKQLENALIERTRNR